MTSSLSVTLPALARWHGSVVSIVNNNQSFHYQVRSRWSDARPVAPTPHDATRRHRGVGGNQRKNPSLESDLTFVVFTVVIVGKSFMSIVKLLGVAQVARILHPARDCCPMSIGVLDERRGVNCASHPHQKRQLVLAPRAGKPHASAWRRCTARDEQREGLKRASRDRHRSHPGRIR